MQQPETISAVRRAIWSRAGSSATTSAPGPVRRGQHRPGSAPGEGLEFVKQTIKGRLYPRRVHHRRREGSRGGARERPGRPLPDRDVSVTSWTARSPRPVDLGDRVQVAGSLASEAAKGAKAPCCDSRTCFGRGHVTPEDFLGSVRRRLKSPAWTRGKARRSAAMRRLVSGGPCPLATRCSAYATQTDTLPPQPK